MVLRAGKRRPGSGFNQHRALPASELLGETLEGTEESWGAGAAGGDKARLARGFHGRPGRPPRALCRARLHPYSTAPGLSRGRESLKFTPDSSSYQREQDASGQGNLPRLASPCFVRVFRLGCNSLPHARKARARPGLRSPGTPAAAPPGPAGFHGCVLPLGSGGGGESRKAQLLCPPPPVPPPRQGAARQSSYVFCMSLPFENVVFHILPFRKRAV